MPVGDNNPLLVLLSQDVNLKSALEEVSGCQWMCFSGLEPLKEQVPAVSAIVIDGRNLSLAELRQRVRTVSSTGTAVVVAIASSAEHADDICGCGAHDLLGPDELSVRHLRRVWAYTQQLREGAGPSNKSAYTKELVFRLLYNLPLTVWFVDKLERIMLVEGEYFSSAELMSDSDDFVGSTLSDWEAIYKEEVELARLALQGGDGKIVVWRDGKWRSVRITPYRNTFGEVVGATGFSADVTAQFDAQNRVRRFLDMESVGVTFWKTDGLITYANNAFLKMIGHEQADVEAGKLNWLDVTPDEYRAADQNAMDHLNTTGSCQAYEKELRCADGSRLPVLVCGGRLDERSDEGVAVFVDLRPVHQARDQLEASRKLFTAAVECSLDGMLLLEAKRGSPEDEHGYLVADLNACAARMLNRGREDVAGRPLEAVLPEEVAERFRDVLNQLKSAEIIQRSFPFDVPGSDVRWVELQAAPLGDGAVVHMRDLTLQKQQEQEVLHSRDLLRTILRSLATHIWLLDRDGRVTDVNDSWLANSYDSGFRRRKTLGKHVSEVLADLMSNQKMLPAAVSAIENVIRKQGGQYVLEYRRERRDRTLYYLMSVTPMRDDFEGAVVATHDITDLKEAQGALAVRSLQQEIVAEVGQAGLADEDPRQLVEAATSGLWRGGAAEAAISYRWSDSSKSFEQVTLLGADEGPPDSEALQAELMELKARLAKSARASVDACAQDAQQPLARWKADQGFRCALFTLSHHGDNTAVLLGAFSRRHRGFSKEDVHFANGIGHVLGSAMERIAAQSALQRRLGQLAALRTMDLAITSSLNLNVTLDVLLRQIITQMDADAAAVLLYDMEQDRLLYVTGRGDITDALRDGVVELGQSYAGAAAQTQKFTYVEDLRAQPEHPLYQRLAEFGQSFVTYYAMPLIAKGRLEGVLELFHKTRVSVDDDQISLLQAMAAQAAIAVHNAELFNRLEVANFSLVSAYDQTLEGWARALDYRDQETEGHSRRVTEGTVRLAHAMGLPETEIIHIRRGSLLHDIGKMAIPDSILLKPGSLNEAEWEIMRRHPVYAREMLLNIEFLAPAIPIPWCHHEHWNGGGYPRGLKGEEIPLAARIFAVIDVWDALRSDRPYRKAWGEAETLDYIINESGKQFDPQVVDAFQRMVEQLSIR